MKCIHVLNDVTAEVKLYGAKVLHSTVGRWPWRDCLKTQGLIHLFSATKTQNNWIQTYKQTEGDRSEEIWNHLQGGNYEFISSFGIHFQPLNAKDLFKVLIHLFIKAKYFWTAENCFALIKLYFPHFNNNFFKSYLHYHLYSHFKPTELDQTAARLRLNSSRLGM